MGLSWAYFFFSHVPFGRKKNNFTRETSDSWHGGSPWTTKSLVSQVYKWGMNWMIVPPEMFWNHPTSCRNPQPMGIPGATQTRIVLIQVQDPLDALDKQGAPPVVFHYSSQSTNWESPSETSSLCASFMLIFLVIPFDHFLWDFFWDVYLMPGDHMFVF